MSAKLRFDFPPDVVCERKQVYARIMDLLAEQTYEAAKEANRLHMDWLRRHPDDAIALDAGEIVAMTLSSYEESEVFEERAALFERIRTLLAEQTCEAAKEANALHLDWLRRYPEDYTALDAGEVISKTISAYDCEERNEPSEPPSKNSVAAK